MFVCSTGNWVEERNYFETIEINTHRFTSIFRRFCKVTSSFCYSFLILITPIKVLVVNTIFLSTVRPDVLHTNCGGNNRSDKCRHCDKWHVQNTDGRDGGEGSRTLCNLTVLEACVQGRIKTLRCLKHRCV